MKKLYTTTETIKYSERRQSKLEQRRLVTKKKKHRRNKNRFIGAEYSKRSIQRKNRNHPITREEITVVITNRLDPMDLSSRTVEICDQIRESVEKGGRNVNIDMSNMEDFTLAGVICLVASIKSQPSDRENRQRSIITGNFPSDPMVASEFVESGFFQGFTVSGGKLPSPKASWTSAEERKVASKKASQLVEFVEPKLRIPQLQKNAIWQNLVECMTNTNNHAKGRKVFESQTGPPEKWFAGVMCRDNTAQFAFVDLGVGICDSAQAKSRLAKVGKSLVGYGDENLVQDAFKGNLGSSTGMRGRGLGLPRMRHNAESGLLQRLQVRTGRVIGNIENMKFQKTKGNFKGTVITWSACTDGGQ